MKRLRRSYGVLLLGLLAPLGGCAGEEPTADEDITATTSALVNQARITAAGAGTTYSNQCKIDNQVPLPPDFSNANLGTGVGKWTFQGTFSDSFVFTGTMADVYTSRSTSPAGLCVIAAHYGGPFDVICQGTNGKACFWEHGTAQPFPTDTPLKIAGTNSFPGGTALTSTRCTSCHVGENVFITHKSFNHPLNQNEVFAEWKPSSWYTPIIPTSWPLGNPGPAGDTPAASGYPSQCLACHKTNGIGGRFPALQLKNGRPNEGSGFCKILSSVVSRPASQGGMPPQAIGVPDCVLGTNCPIDDPAVKDMMKACGGTFPLLPTIAGVASPGAGTGQLAAKKHHSASLAGWHDHYFYGATETMPKTGCCAPHQNAHAALKSTDEINVSVFIPEDDKPNGIVISVDTVAGGSYYAYWGPSVSPSPGVRPGGLPTPGSWQVLKFRPNQIGMPNNSVLNGAGFQIKDGSAFFADMLFRSSDAPYNLQYVSQVWFKDALPAGALSGAGNGDFWDFDYPPPISP